MRLVQSLALLAVFAVPAAAVADTVTYADITASNGTTVTGTLAGVAFTITGQTSLVQLSGVGPTNYFTDSGKVSPGVVYVGGNISNAPTDLAIVEIAQPNLTYTITFASAIAGTLVFDGVSLGAPGAAVSYTFDHTFTVEDCGTGYWGGGCPAQAKGSTGNTVLSGEEASEALEFDGVTNELSFTVGPASENWNGFDIGLLPPSAVPEPSSIALLGTGILSAAGFARRKFRG